MNQQIADSSASTTFYQSSSQSFNSGNAQKYGGLIEQSLYKRTRLMLSQLMNYVYSVAPPFVPVHVLIIFFRLLQFGAPSFCSGYNNLWSKSDYSYQIVSYLSILFHLIPSDYRESSGMYLMIAYIVVVGLMIILLVVSAKYFQKSASLPSILPSMISFYFASLGYVLHPIAFETGFGMISQLAFVKTGSTMDIVAKSVVVAFAIIVSIIYFWIFLSIASQSLIFRPNSLQSATSPPQNLMLLSQVVVTILIALSERAKPTVQAVFLFITAIVYLVSSLTCFVYGGIISTFLSAAYLATCLTGFVASVVVAVMVLTGKEAKLIFLIAFFILWTVAFIGCIMMMNMLKTHYLVILDAIVDNEENFDKIRNVNQLINIIVAGFSVAHPACIGWSILRFGVEKWPENQMSWFIYAKFVSIYPEETQTLAWIFRMIISNKVHGSAAKAVKEQSLSIARQREPNLSPDLKTKLNLVAKHLTSTKHKLRHVWDLAIQGNISDMESATKRAIHDVNQSDAELLHIFRQFPNNRFVTRQYARFCRELKADHVAYLEMVEKTRYLQRGITVNKDQAHEFGLATFHDLPDKISMNRENAMLTGPGTESQTASQLDIETEDDANTEADESLVLVGRIENLVIPSTRYSMIIRVVMFVILFCAPVIALLVYTPMFTKNISEPLDHLANLAMLRTYVFQITGFSEERIYEMLGLFNNPNATTSRNPESVGGSWRTVDQLVYVTAQITSKMQDVETFRTFQANNAWVKKAQDSIFTPSIKYSYYQGLIATPKMITVQSAIADFVQQQSDLISPGVTLVNSDINSSIMLNLIMNVPSLTSTLDKATTYFMEYISEQDDSTSATIRMIMYIAIVVIVIFYLGALAIQLYWINNNKEQVYRCLTALPKNAVSALTENLRVLKKEAENSSSSMANTEMNKQEDNIMKIFVTGGNNSSTKIVDAILLIASSLIIVGLHIGCNFMLTGLLIDQSASLRQNSPHLNNLQGAYSLMMGCLTSMVMMLVNGLDEYNVVLIDKDFLVSQYEERIAQAKTFFHSARFGGALVTEPPYSGFDVGVQNAAALVDCPDPNKITDDFMETALCYQADMLYVMLEGIMNSRIVPFKESPQRGIDMDSVVDNIWALMIFPIYDAFFFPMFTTIVPTIVSDLGNLKTNVNPPVIAMFIIALFVEVVAIIQTIRIETHIRSVLKLLLHVPSKIVMQTNKIMTVLSGDFAKHRGDTANRDAEFFHSVVLNLPDAVIVANQENIIENVNKSFGRILGVEDNVAVGKPIQEFLRNSFSGEIGNLILAANETKTKTEKIAFDKGDGTETILEATSLNINNRFVILLRDTTQTVRYNTLINEEKQKSDLLLSSILPPSLVKRVQAGEKNISFAVQTATIVFMDIVSFTPWCGSLPADKVMMTLNLLFKKLDALVAKYPTMTKIKCIGDCYMAAGGVFSEMNQPAEHAKEVVSFGIDALNAISELNQELNEKLQIRVGINTGGPIVAGVLGIGKPTFEILGPAINMAQQMEHHGVPMQVHVSRSVYELIYGDTFVIKERGSVEVKGGNVITYLVSRK